MERGGESRGEWKGVGRGRGKGRGGGGGERGGEGSSGGEEKGGKKRGAPSPPFQTRGFQKLAGLTSSGAVQDLATAPATPPENR